MPSIYDFLPPGSREQAGYAGLGALAQALLAGGAPTTTPGGGIAAMGQGFGGFGQAYNQRLMSGLQQAAMGQQLAEAERKRKQQEAQMASIQGMFTSPPVQMAMAGNAQPGPTMQAAAKAQPPIAQLFPGQDINALREYATAFPEQFSRTVGERLTAKPPDGYTLGPDQVRYDASGKVIARGPERAAKPTEFQQAMIDAGYTPGTPEYKKAAADYVARKGLPMQVTNQVDLKQENEEAKVVGKNFGEIYTGLVNAEMRAPSQIGKLDRLDALLSKTYTGLGAEQVQAASKALKAAGDAAGVNTSGLSEKIGAAEAATALANEMALELRNPAGGAGMPGAMSDSDRDFLKTMTPGMATTPEGRKQIVETRRRLIRREQQVAKMARDYRKKNGSLNEGFFDELAAFSEKNPLFADMKPAEGPAASGNNPYSSMSDEQILQQLRAQGVLK
jgi:hypothetical protein